MRILIAYDHGIVRGGLKLLIENFHVESRGFPGGERIHFSAKRIDLS